MNMNSHHIEGDEMLISKRIYQMVDTIGVAGEIEILRGMTASSVEDLDIGYIGRALKNHATTGYSPPEGVSLPHLIERQTAMSGAKREAPPSDPAAFDAWIVALFLQNIDTTYQLPQWLYARRRAPHHIPPTDPAAFDA
ncbi:hypothetical protein IW261DRAFT_1425054 [Armillaria novae-zelandiae]|uniref:Uncharacterized protein n=1 Tax=Armillaria novae-zelandiae TaxID=153914 RepID=A0AA39NU47_9AGAR|nr:hypothetical protein IW261DRAFT_1425054 [Armillaria novae-zelandiae]